MSHDRGCYRCGRDRMEYAGCSNTNCSKQTVVVTDAERELSMADQKQPSDFINDRPVAQVGGDHYESSYEHWDWAADQQLCYFVAAATKYIVRWRSKGGAKDLKKAYSYMEKYESLLKRDCIIPGLKKVNEQKFKNFIEANSVPGLEALCCRLMVTFTKGTPLGPITTIIDHLIASAEAS